MATCRGDSPDTGQPFCTLANSQTWSLRRCGDDGQRCSGISTHAAQTPHKRRILYLLLSQPKLHLVTSLTTFQISISRPTWNAHHYSTSSGYLNTRTNTPKSSLPVRATIAQFQASVFVDAKPTHEISTHATTPATRPGPLTRPRTIPS